MDRLQTARCFRNNETLFCFSFAGKRIVEFYRSCSSYLVTLESSEKQGSVANLCSHGTMNNDDERQGLGLWQQQDKWQ